MSIVIAPRRTGQTANKEAPNLRDCGPEGCDIDWLSSQRHTTEIDDIVAFTQYALDQGWGDGLPLAEVADCAGTIGYELTTRMPARTPRVAG